MSEGDVLQLKGPIPGEDDPAEELSTGIAVASNTCLILRHAT